MSWVSKLTGVHIKVPGLSQLGDVIQGAASAAIPGVSTALDVGGRIVNGLPIGSNQPVPGNGIMTPGLTDLLKKYGIPVGVGALGAYQSGQARNTAQNTMNKGLGYATDAYNAKAPIRTMALSQLQNPTKLNLAAPLSTGYRNPFARPQ